MALATLEDKNRIESELGWDQRKPADTLYQLLDDVRKRCGDRNALSFQLLSEPNSKSETLTWSEMHDRVVQAANLFCSLGIGENDVVALLLPNSTETAIALLAAEIAGIACPINPLIGADQIARILQASNARVLVALKPFPKTDLAQLASEAANQCPEIRHVLEIDLGRHLAPPKSWIIPLVRPKSPPYRSAAVQDFNQAIARQRSDGLDFEDSGPDRVGAMFHTGGTTGMPKLTRHRYGGMIYNGWVSAVVGLSSEDVIACPLPLFHVFAAYPLLMSAVASGCHIVLPTPAGYRGDGVFDNFWKLVERWKITFIAMVPTAAAALMQRPVNADISSLKRAFCGSAPMPLELYRRFESTAGVEILEGYGLTEITCIASVNPMEGERKVGSVGIPIPYTDIRILDCDESGQILREFPTGEVGEICISSPGVWPGNTYTDPDRNTGLIADGKWLRTGDLGRIDDDGYLWITGRAKDLIIRGGHNVDPAILEEAMAEHGAVAFAGAVGQPDPRLGELPCIYVELTDGSTASDQELLDFATAHIADRLAVPAHVEVMDSLPKTAVGKVFKPSLRKRAINRVLTARLLDEGGIAALTDIIEDPARGLVVRLEAPPDADRDRISEVVNQYTVQWEFEN